MARCGFDTGRCLFRLPDGPCDGDEELHGQMHRDYPTLKIHDYDGGCRAQREAPNQWGEVYCAAGHLVARVR